MFSLNYSLGSDVESEPTEKLIAEGRVGSVLGALGCNRVFELQKIAVRNLLMEFHYFLILM